VLSQLCDGSTVIHDICSSSSSSSSTFFLLFFHGGGYAIKSVSLSFCLFAALLQK